MTEVKNSKKQPILTTGRGFGDQLNKSSKRKGVN